MTRLSKQNRHVDSLARLFRILGDPTRLRILMLLDSQERNVSDLCRRLKMPQPTVSHHLSLLRMGELVATRRNGKEIFYSLRDIRRDRSGKAIRAVLAGTHAIRLGPILVGMAEP